MKKISVFLFSLILTGITFAGDMSNFVNLGFSESGDYFLFGEYGIVTDFQKTYANMWLVDVKRNSFVTNGVMSGEYKTVIEPGESAIGALLKLLVEGQSVIKKYNIDYLEQGRPLYVRINDSNDVDNLKFRDFLTGLSYDITLVKDVTDKASSFYINLETADKSGKKNTYKVGNPSYKRDGVVNYKIERILHTSEGSSLVIVISKYIKSDDEVNVRYMVETISLK